VTERAKPLLWVLVSGAVIAATLLAVSFVLATGSLAHAATLLSSVSMCVVSLAKTRTLPLGLFLPIVLASGSAVSLVRTLRRYREERRLFTSLPLEPVSGGDLAEVARAESLDVYRTAASRPAAFCFGLLRPRIVFTSGLLDRLSNDEQVAALWHEAQHARMREPLRCLIARLSSATFFWLPVLRDIFDRYTLVRELDADRLAMSNASARALAGALHGVAATSPLVGAVGFADFAAARVDRLLDPAVPLPSLFKRTRLALSLGAVALLGLAFTYPTNVAVSKHVRMQPMMMKVHVLTPTGIHTELVGCSM
jgi:hypothetical protein